MRAMKAVIFDFDGTLADSLEGVLAVYAGPLRRVDPFTAEEIASSRNLSLLRLGRKLGLSWPTMIKLAVYGQHAFKLHIDKVRLYEGIAELLHDLDAAGIKMYIISTNLQSSIDTFLRKHGLSQYIHQVYGRAFVLDKSGKIRTLLRTEKLHREDVCYVGDEVVDIRSARRAGIKAVSVTWGYASRAGLSARRPDYLVDSVPELKEIL